MSSLLYPMCVPGQYFETCDGSSSSVTINTTTIPLGAEVIEVMVYRKRERRKYSPLTTDNTVFYVTGETKIIQLHQTICFYRHQINHLTSSNHTHSVR